MRIKTTEFEFAHGRKPRGRGTWMFTADSFDSLQPNTPVEEFFQAPSNTKYSDAAKLARTWARRNSFINLRLGS